MAEKKIVKNNSKAYGYNYSSLGDIVNQGFDVPKMRIKPTEFGEFIEYQDENGEWQIGSKIVVPVMKSSNEAQCYGAALTYARRYTALMALGLVCDDDTKLEATAPAKSAPKQAKTYGKFDFNEFRAEIKKCATTEELNALYLTCPEKLRQYFVKDCEKRKAEIDVKAN